MKVIDLFAGPGGWDIGARRIGIDPFGVEWDDNACATRRAAGLRTLQGDVAALDPTDVMTTAFRDIQIDGLIASPPCQSFSMAGKRGGEKDTEHVIACAHELAAGNDSRAEHAAKCEDARSMLVVEPIRWVRELRPRWVACEQVPPVLELWSLFAQILGVWGYKTWTGILSSERYGVPQTRKRAILMASLDEQPHPPEATHQAYVPGESARHDVSMFGETLPWVSMAQALGWKEVEYVQRVRSGERSDEGFDPRFAPCQSMTSKTRSWSVRTSFGEPHRGHDAGSPKPEFDPLTQPSRTVCGKTGDWKIAGGPNLLGLKDPDWPTRRPATTIAGDPRVFQPGGHHQEGEQSQNAVRVTVREASILQSFPPDYPWQGSRSAKFQQIGNAVPPLLAEHILIALTGAQRLEEAA